MNTASCPNCGEKIRLKTKPQTKQVISCPLCSSRLQIISESPLILVPAEQNWEGLNNDSRDPNHSERSKRRSYSEKERGNDEAVLEIQDEEDEIDEIKVLAAKKHHSPKRANIDKRRYAPHQYNFDEDDF